MKIIKTFFALTLFACSTDVSIMKRPGENSNNDTAMASTTDEDTQGNQTDEPGSSEPSSEPANEMSELTVGYSEIHFRQIACPPCVGATTEFDISATLKLHYPTSGS